MNTILLAFFLFIMAAGITYRWWLYNKSIDVELELNSLNCAPRTKVTIKASRIRQLHDAIDNYRIFMPAKCDNALILDYSNKISQYADVMTMSSVEMAIRNMLSERRQSAHRFGVYLYVMVLEQIRQDNSVIHKPEEVSKIYKDAIWLARCHGHGLSDGVTTDEVLRLFDDGQKYCWGNYKEDVSWFTFERAIFLTKYFDHEKSFSTLEDGLKYLGYNFDRDGSVLHELGLSLMRKSHREKNTELLLESVEKFNLSISAKEKSGNRVTPLFSKKMKLEALSEYYFTKKMKGDFLSLKSQYIALVLEWEMAIPELESGGLKALPELYLACAMNLIINSDSSNAVSYLYKCKYALLKYDPSNTEDLNRVDKMLAKYDPSGSLR